VWINGVGWVISMAPVMTATPVLGYVPSRIIVRACGWRIDPWGSFSSPNGGKIAQGLRDFAKLNLRLSLSLQLRLSQSLSICLGPQ
jgi:hypothetical protein